MFRVQRMEEALQRGDPVYFAQTFTGREYTAGLSSEHPSVWFAERLALKEASFKSLGVKWTEEMAWNQIESLPADCGAPSVALSGEMAAVASSSGARCLSASVSGDGDYVIAVVVTET